MEEVMDVALLSEVSPGPGPAGRRRGHSFCGSPRASNAIFLRYPCSCQFVLGLTRATNREIGNVNWTERACMNLISFSSASATTSSRTAPRAGFYLGAKAELEPSTGMGGWVSAQVLQEEPATDHHWPRATPAS